MNRDILGQLQRTSPLIRAQWESLLRSEPVNSPLANADAMAEHIPKSIATILHALEGPFSRKRAERGLHARRTADCGHNPYRAYYRAGEQALAEAVVLAQTACHADTRDETDQAEMIGMVRAVAEPEIDGFCAVCRKYGLISNCRYAGARRPAAATGAM